MSTPTAETNNSDNKGKMTPVSEVLSTTTQQQSKPVDNHTNTPVSGIKTVSPGEQPWKPLTRKQKIFADALIDDPKLSGTKAALKAYNTTETTAAVIATENLRKPSIQAYMASQGHEASSIAVKLMRNSSKLGLDGSLGHARLAFDITEAINDRIHGKAVIKTDNKSVKINIQSVLD